MSASTALPAATWPGPASPSQEDWALLEIRGGRGGAYELLREQGREEERAEHTWARLPDEGQAQSEV